MAKSSKTKIEVSDQGAEDTTKNTPDKENTRANINIYKNSKSTAVLAIIVGIIVIIGGYAFYKISNREGKINTEEPIATVDLTEQTSDLSDSEGIIQPADQKSQPIQILNQAETQTPPTSASLWKAYNHTPGDIQEKTYTVVNGDTLWEIAEGAYGNGTLWHQIAEANNVRYLSNGNPLILPGQVLTIP